MLVGSRGQCKSSQVWCGKGHVELVLWKILFMVAQKDVTERCGNADVGSIALNGEVPWDAW